MKKIFDRSKKSNENIAESLLVPTILLISLISLIYFRNETAVRLVGPDSIGFITLILGVILSFVLFVPFYIYGLKAKSEKLSRKQLGFNIVTLSVATAIMTILVTAIGVELASQAFKELTLDKYTSSVIVGIYAGLVVYLLVPASINLNTQSIVRIFSVVMVCGMLLSMITSSNPLWWQINFSSLGSIAGPSAKVFNFTLLLSGMVLITMSFHLLDDIRKLMISGSNKSKNARINILKGLFVFIGICMAGVGVFTYAENPLMHNLSAYSMVLGFAIIIIGLKKILPFIDATFLANSYFTLAVIGVCYFLFTRVHYLNLTAFELLAFGITFAWLVLFVRKISSLHGEV
ncbi:MAG: hypothetical protein QG675_676 [Patescibacteria group bacterium]|jgi:hypothetical membrane protein|nr:hypothetical protein [Patescibacteria group bacterium]